MRHLNHPVGGADDHQRRGETQLQPRDPLDDLRMMLANAICISLRVARLEASVSTPCAVATARRPYELRRPRKDRPRQAGDRTLADTATQRRRRAAGYQIATRATRTSCCTTAATAYSSAAPRCSSSPGWPPRTRSGSRSGVGEAVEPVEPAGERVGGQARRQADRQSSQRRGLEGPGYCQDQEEIDVDGEAPGSPHPQRVEKHHEQQARTNLRTLIQGGLLEIRRVAAPAPARRPDRAGRSRPRAHLDAQEQLVAGSIPTIDRSECRVGRCRRSRRDHLVPEPHIASQGHEVEPQHPSSAPTNTPWRRVRRIIAPTVADRSVSSCTLA